MSDDQIWQYINTCVQHYASEQNIVVLPASDAEELRELE